MTSFFQRFNTYQTLATYPMHATPEGKLDYSTEWEGEAGFSRL